MHARLIGLDPAPFQHLFGLENEALARRNVARIAVDAKPGYPCRVTLRDAEPGETVLLLPFEHLGGNTPYRGSGPIFVHEGARTPWNATAIPDEMRSRLFSVRAYDEASMMIDADVVDGGNLEEAFDRLFGRADTRFIHLHHARRGCFACRVERA
jgi:hypothetical protein